MFKNEILNQKICGQKRYYSFKDTWKEIKQTFFADVSIFPWRSSMKLGLSFPGFFASPYWARGGVTSCCCCCGGVSSLSAVFNNSVKSSNWSWTEDDESLPLLMIKKKIENQLKVNWEWNFVGKHIDKSFVEIKSQCISKTKRHKTIRRWAYFKSILPCIWRAMNTPEIIFEL